MVQELDMYCRLHYLCTIPCIGKFPFDEFR